MLYQVATYYGDLRISATLTRHKPPAAACDILVEDGDFFGDGVNIAARLELDPNSFFARGYLGVSYGFGGDYETALPHLEEAMRLSPRGLLLVI